jgi:vitamin B12 transporter
MSLLLLITAEAAALSSSSPQILVTASRAAVSAEDAGVSATVIDEDRIDALGESQAIDLLRLAPGISVSVSGARGAQAQLRIRGGEANHSLVFIDGIAFTDPASGNESRFETLSADGLGRIEVIRGPQSALWGSEALGGVIALSSPNPLGGTRVTGFGEYGSRDGVRGGGSATVTGDGYGITATASHAQSDGIDIVGGGTGDRDGFENTSAGLLAIARPGSNGEIGLAARLIAAESEFDGFDPVFFTRADTLDTSESETAALRIWGALGIDPDSPWTVRAEAQYLSSENRNLNAGNPLNRTEGSRWRLSGQLERRLSFGGTNHVVIAAVEREDERFQARDQQYFGATDQDQDRGRTGFVGEWRAEWGSVISTDIALRHDDFEAFEDATTIRGTIVARISEQLSLHASYGEGIAQPSFFDLFGFFPGSFVGNPALGPETAHGYEVGAMWQDTDFHVSLTVFESNLENEIVSVFDSVTFLSSTANATGESKRRGIEAAFTVTPLPGLRIDANYTYLDAEDQQVSGNARLREIRRPRHSANIAFDYQSGPLTIGGSMAYIGKRQDTDFDLFPAQTVALGRYVLASARIAYSVIPGIEVYGRVTNLFDEEYQDVVGYSTPGMAAYAGLRFRFGD